MAWSEEHSPRYMSTQRFATLKTQRFKHARAGIAIASRGQRRRLIRNNWQPSVLMLEKTSAIFDSALGIGLESHPLTALQMVLRAALVFIAAMLMLRIGDRRFMGKNAPLDLMLAIVFGSVVSRAITGNSPFFPTLAAAFVLVGMHWAVAALSFHVPFFSKFSKGRATLLVEDGKIKWDAMRKTHIGEHDLREALRAHGMTEDVTQVKSAHLERNGSISIR